MQHIPFGWRVQCSSTPSKSQKGWDCASNEFSVDSAPQNYLPIYRSMVNKPDPFFVHSCWKQWMRYRGGADVDGSCRPWTEVVFRGRKLHCGPWTEVVSHTTPPHLVKVKINFDEAQKLTWKEIKCLYGFITIITSKNISELLKMQLESRSRNVHTWGTRSGFISTQAVTTRKSIRGSLIGKPRICHYPL